MPPDPPDPPEATQQPQRTELWLLDTAAVRASTGLSRTAMSDSGLMAELSFPQPVYHGQRRYWRSDEVEAWIRALPRQPQQRPRDRNAAAA